MTIEQNRSYGESHEQAVEPVVQAIDVARVKDAFRQQNDPQLLTVVRDFDTVLATCFPDYYNERLKSERVKKEERSSVTPQVDPREVEPLHWFGYQEGGHNWLLAVGPARAGLGLSEQSLSITQYYADQENPRQPQAIIGTTIFSYKSSELASLQGTADLENASVAILHFPAIIYGHPYALDIHKSNAYGYSHGEVADERRLLQMGVDISARTGFLMSAHERFDGQGNPLPPLNVLNHAQQLVFRLQDENSYYIESRPMDFDPARG